MAWRVEKDPSMTSTPTVVMAMAKNPIATITSTKLCPGQRRISFNFHFAFGIDNNLTALAGASGQDNFSAIRRLPPRRAEDHIIPTDDNLGQRNSSRKVIDLVKNLIPAGESRSTEHGERGAGSGHQMNAKRAPRLPGKGPPLGPPERVEELLDGNIEPPLGFKSGGEGQAENGQDGNDRNR